MSFCFCWFWHSSIFCNWVFLFQISVFEADQNPSLRPGAAWKDTILDPEIAKLFFQVTFLLQFLIDLPSKQN